jgi:hypothetical protein
MRGPVGGLMTDAETNRRFSIALAIVTVVQLLGTWVAVAEIRELLVGLGAEMPMVVRAGLALFRYPVLGITAIPLFAVLALKARPATTFVAFLAAWLLGVLGGATVCWALGLLNHVLAENVR